MWLIPKTLSLSVPGSECWTKDSMPDSDTLASRAGRLPMSSGKVTLPASLLRSWKANAWMRRLCGAAIWQDSHSQDFEDWYTASLLASPASLTPSPGSGPGLKMSGGSGRPLCKAYATLTPIGFISKTFQGSLLQADSQPALLILPRQGSMWNGELYERPTLVHRISGKESSSSPSDKAWSRWDTPDTMPEMPNTGSNRKAQPAGLGNQAQIVTNWKTPHGMAGIDHTGKIGGGGEFAKQVEQWATPQARDEKSPDSPDSQNYARKLEAGWTIDLNSQAGAWPTPCARDHKGANAEAGLTRADGGGRMDQLANAAVYSPQAQAIHDGQESSETSLGSRPRLNPAFAAWLMGWPSLWTHPDVTSSEQLGMALFRSRLHSDLCNLLDASEIKKAA